jgi:hypothetical protein
MGDTFDFLERRATIRAGASREHPESIDIVTRTLDETFRERIDLRENFALPVATSGNLARRGCLIP